jgi:hypothetical protein
MEWVTIAVLVMKVISMVEALFGEAKGQGVVKKATAVNVIKDSLTGLQSVSTGGQKETIDALIPVIDPLIDAGVALMNQTSQLFGGADVIDTSSDLGKG